MALKTRKPTGQASWPLVLLAGMQGAGKSYGAAVASASPLVGRTLWVSIGERDPDDYGAVRDADGNLADFEIVEHDGSYAGIRQAFADAVAEPPVDGLPTLLVGDSMTRLWNLITENVQGIANARKKGTRAAATGDYTVTSDLWNQAAQQWADVMNIITSHEGPVILTARLDSVTVMENGQPTKEKTWKVQGHKSLPFDVDAQVELYSRGEFMLTKVKTVANPLDRPRPVPNFTVPWLWDQIGVSGMGSPRKHTVTRTDESVAAERALQRPQARVAQQQRPPQRVQQPAVGGSGRKWVAEAKSLTTKEQLRVLFNECKHANELVPEVERDLMQIAATLPDEAEQRGEWAESAPAGAAWAEGDEPQPADEPVVTGGVVVAS